MPKIQEYFSQARAGGGLLTRRATGEDFGAGIGRALGQVAGAVREVGAIQEQREDRQGAYELKKERIRQAEAYGKVVTDLEGFALEQGQRLEEPSVDIYNFKNNEISAFDERANTLLEKAKITSPETQIKLQSKIGSLRQRVTTGAYEAESSAIKARRDKTVDNAMATLAQGVLSSTLGFEEAMFDVEDTLAEFRDTYSPGQFREAVESHKAKIAVTSIRKISQTDPQAARNLLGGDLAAESLTSDDMFQLDEYITRQQTKIEREAAQARAAQEQQLTKLDNYNAVLNAISVGAPIDPKQKETKDAINDFYEQSGMSVGLASGQPEAAQQLAFFASRATVIPNGAVSTLRGQLLNGSTEQRQYAADVIGRIEEVSPKALDSFPRSDLSKVTLANGLIRTGVPVNRAFDIAEENIDPLNKDIIKQRNIQLNAEKIDYAVDVEDLFDPSIFIVGANIPDAPEARDSIIADYKLIRDNYYRSIGDVDAAKERADIDFKRFYGVSDVTGRNQIMKYAPENYYSIPNVDNDWMQEQLIKDVSVLKGKEIDIDDIEILADTVTAGEAVPNGKPSYQVFVKGDAGEWEELRDGNDKLLRYKFDSSSVTEDLKKEKAEDIEQSRRIRRLNTQGVIGSEAERRDEEILRMRTLF